jgi:hypothetical protein
MLVHGSHGSYSLYTPLLVAGPSELRGQMGETERVKNDKVY